MAKVEYPPLLELDSEDDYRAHFYAEYCSGPTSTFDDIEVRFRRRDFDHAFFESSSPNSKDDTFSDHSGGRAERMDWIKFALNDPSADIRCGYDNRLRQKDASRRVAIVKGNFVVIIRLTGNKKAEFVTCYVATTWTLQKIRRSSKWPRQKPQKPDADGSA